MLDQLLLSQIDIHAKDHQKQLLEMRNRFKKIYKLFNARKRIPHAYLTNLKEILGRKGLKNYEHLQQTLTNPSSYGPAMSIPKSARFSIFNKTGPGPGDYNIRENEDFSTLTISPSKSKFKGSKSIRAKTARRAYANRTTNKSTFGHAYDCSRRIWFNGFDQFFFLNKEGPGPARYEPKDQSQSIYVNMPKFKFSNSSRWMNILDDNEIRSRSKKTRSRSRQNDQIVENEREVQK